MLALLGSAVQYQRMCEQVLAAKTWRVSLQQVLAQAQAPVLTPGACPALNHAGIARAVGLAQADLEQEAKPGLQEWAAKSQQVHWPSYHATT